MVGLITNVPHGVYPTGISGDGHLPVNVFVLPAEVRVH